MHQPRQIPQNAGLRETILLHPAKSGNTRDLSPSARGLFGRNIVTINLSGHEKEICIAGGKDPKDPLTIDDVAIITVKREEQVIGQWSLPGYDEKTGGIGPRPSQTIKWMFPSPGNYEILIELRDLVGPVWSTPDLIIYIWE